VFQTTTWGKVVESIGQSAHRLCVRDGRGRLTGVALIIRRRTNSLLSVLGLNRGVINWGPVAIDEGYLRNLLMRVSEEAAKLRACEIVITNDTFPESSFVEAGFLSLRSGLEYEFVLPLNRSIETLWNGLDKDCRSAVRKAERDGVEVVEGDCDDFYELYLQTRSRLGAKVTPRKFFKAIQEIMVPLGMATFLIAKLNGIKIAAIITLRFGNVAWYYEGVSDESYWIHRANNLLQWRAIERALSKGATLYNLTQSGSPEKNNPYYGLYLFKSQFGGELRPLRTFRCTTRRHRYLGRAIYRLAAV
jgi:hypothetical protein